MSNIRVLLAPAAGWLLAQGFKYALQLRKDGFQLRDFYASGGFPSSHTSSTVALAAYVGATEGWTSNIFAVAALFTAVVMYDAVGVRRAVGQNARILKELVDKEKQTGKITPVRAPMGHTPTEVLGGLVLGIVVGLVFAAF